MLTIKGTGTWSTREVADRHVAAPAIAASHILRIISSDKQTRGKVADNLQIPQPHEAQKVVKQMGEQEKKDFLEVVHQAVYGCILAGFVQGLEVSTGDLDNTDYPDRRLMLFLDHHQSIHHAKMGCFATRLSFDLACRLHHPVR